MFGWTITFLLLAIIAGIFGFSGRDGTSAFIAQALSIIGLVLFLGLLLRVMPFGRSRRDLRPHSSAQAEPPNHHSPASRAAVAARQQKNAL